MSKDAAIMQWEMDRAVFSGRRLKMPYDCHDDDARRHLLKLALDDVLQNGGTLVVVVTADKVTVVQRPLGADEEAT